MTADDVQPISLYYRSPDLMPELVEYVVTLPTFRRPDHLFATLKSLEEQSFEKSFCVIVMENDADQQSGAQVARDFLESGKLRGLVIIAHQRGNCHAYNAGWKTALETFPSFRAIAVIDDDEIADPNWLEALTETKHELAVDMVGAPQIPVFEDTGHDHWRRHPVFEAPYRSTSAVPVLYSSGNVLISRQVLEQMPQPHLDISFNFIGGGDSDFYSRAGERGFRFGWCETAPVFETIPARRLTKTWINARSQREGSISALIENRRRKGLTGHGITLFKSLLMLTASPVRAMRLAMSSGSVFTGSYFIHVAIGRFLAEFGAVNEQYRNPESN